MHKQTRRFLYVGGFELPDHNAAALRVLNIAKAIRLIGHEVIFLNYSSHVLQNNLKVYSGFQCYEYPKQTLLKHLTAISHIKNIIENEGITDIIAYNNPAISLWRMMRYCKKKHIRCYADATEWYASSYFTLRGIAINIDTALRMRILHKKMSGVIAISEYLYQYYQGWVDTVKVPPLSDKIECDAVPLMECKGERQTVKIVYAGSPSAQKEQLDSIVCAIEKVGAPIELEIIGIKKEEYEKIYKIKYIGTQVHFLGRISRDEVLQKTKRADWTIIIRSNNRVVKAGFPTKVVESISLGVPVIANRFSNIDEYLNENNSIVIADEQDLEQAIKKAAGETKTVNDMIFDYTLWLPELMKLFG